ncbi:asparagine synthase (glutamine-hydrolyzing) [Cyclobacterium jeungdonense]|uniref:asparagine synthase (glutamine-hydrolyzing) n=1 Tax=Cyclobacterium jeungdonense TaxID=708087 RepID=A0ABT8C656_9BACT|nr:asparagine synthase (glutamine-hydrolyzing) [Cyclobacterium jeungdonense]MDN3687166.1 asparagine synthase (glutamine-hydrolyzing) [Cyclobacterium jeungdonense]
MCGVHLLVNSTGKGGESIQAMMEACQHRGPDHSSWMEVSKGIYLAANRLKILDLRDQANQPVVNEEEEAYLSWNGFLYNYQELKNQLLMEGVVFKSTSDGEVLLMWLIRKGREGVQQLQGMYAFAFVHTKKNQVILGRDPLGVKSLYFTQQKGILGCSSEIRCLLRADLVPKKLHQEQFLPYFYLRHVLPGDTFIRGIQELLPGELKTWNLKGEPLDAREIPLGVPAPKPALTEKGFEEIMTDAVLKHFHADVPLGLILSGGADSTLLYHLWYRQTGQVLPTFTIGFQDAYRKKFRDADFAAKLVSSRKAFHQEVIISPEWFLETWPAYIRDLDQPVGDSASYLTWALARKAKESVKILASGAGADELFGGYNRHLAYKRYLQNPIFWNGVAAKFKRIPLVGNTFQRFLSGIHPSPQRTFMNFASLSVLPDSLANALEGRYSLGEQLFKNALEWDRTLYLVHDLLKIHDNACMAHGIEGRVPFLDWKVVDWSLRLGEKEARNAAPKFWVKSLLKREGLTGFARRKKFGFGLPIKEWLVEHAAFRNKVLSSVIDLGIQYQEMVPEEWRPLVQRPERYISSHFLLLFNLFVLSDWIKENQL